MVLQTDIELIEKLFTPAPRYKGRNPKMENIHTQKGKHILEDYREEKYMSCAQFDACMKFLKIKPFKNTTDVYPLRLKPEYGDLWSHDVRRNRPI